MSKSKFADSLKGLSSDQFDRVAADLVAEAARRGNTADDWGRVASMTQNEFDNFTRNAISEVERGRSGRELEAAAARSGKVLVDPKSAAETEGNDDGNS